MKNIDYLILEHKGLVYKQLHRYNMIGDWEAESIAFEALWKAFGDYDANHTSNAAFGTYATTCIYNALGTYAKTFKRVRQLEVVTLEDYTEAFESNSVEVVIIQEERAEKINFALAKLRDSLTNPTHKRLFAAWEASDFEGSKTELATAAKCSQPYVSQTIAVFKHKIKTYLKECNYE